eukprot:3372815-Rhodomonas_salina.1
MSVPHTAHPLAVLSAAAQDGVGGTSSSSSEPSSPLLSSSSTARTPAQYQAATAYRSTGQRLADA